MKDENKERYWNQECITAATVPWRNVLCCAFEGNTRALPVLWAKILSVEMLTHCDGFTSVKWSHPWSSTGWEKHCNFSASQPSNPHWINCTVLHVKLKKIRLLVPASENFEDVRFFTQQQQHHSYLNDAEYKGVKESDCKPKKVLWQSVEKEIISTGDSFCLSLCRQEESAGDWKKQRVKKKNDAGRQRQRVLTKVLNIFCPMSELRMCHSNV